jgi:hypothetical protein
VILAYLGISFIFIIKLINRNTNMKSSGRLNKVSFLILILRAVLGVLTPLFRN